MGRFVAAPEPGDPFEIRAEDPFFGEESEESQEDQELYYELLEIAETLHRAAALPYEQLVAEGFIAEGRPSFELEDVFPPEPLTDGDVDSILANIGISAVSAADRPAVRLILDEAYTSLREGVPRPVSPRGVATLSNIRDPRLRRIMLERVVRPMGVTAGRQLYGALPAPLQALLDPVGGRQLAGSLGGAAVAPMAELLARLGGGRVPAHATAALVAALGGVSWLVGTDRVSAASTALYAWITELFAGAGAAPPTLSPVPGTRLVPSARSRRASARPHMLALAALDANLLSMGGPAAASIRTLAAIGSRAPLLAREKVLLAAAWESVRGRALAWRPPPSVRVARRNEALRPLARREVQPGGNIGLNPIVSRRLIL